MTQEDETSIESREDRQVRHEDHSSVETEARRVGVDEALMSVKPINYMSQHNA